MSIEYSESASTFHLKTRSSSYVVGIAAGKHPISLHWGGRLREWRGAANPPVELRAFAPEHDPAIPFLSLDALPREYPAFGNSDFRAPAFQVLQDDGSTITDLAYRGHRIFPGKGALPGLPATYAEEGDGVETLELELFDELIGLEVRLSYSVFPQADAIARSVRFRNLGKQKLTILRALSASVDLPSSGYEMLQLPGDWGRERAVVRRALAPGIQSVQSRRGASSHQANPFIALLEPGAGEDKGEVLAMSLVYSGNFLAQAEVDSKGGTRLAIGIDPFEFSWLLEPGESFHTPEAILVRSPEGLGGMSERFHSLFRTRLCRGRQRDAERPILVNNWEATYFDFDAEKIAALASEAGKLGLELLVLDDGWFGHRDDDRSSLGDWTEDRRKLPLGLSDLASRVGKEGLKFGLWFEPEMVSPDSDLYRAHPDWCLHAPGRPRSQSRNQLVLDMGRPEVARYVIDSVSAVLRSAPIAYVKWDMNRHMTEACSAGLPPARQKETQHRYMLGLYGAMEELTRSFPDVLFEGCSGGGGRFDPGILAYMSQVWTSDNTDAVARLAIQYGTSLVYPPLTMGCHVSAVPNHQVGRTTSLDFRGLVAMSGNLGYELDLGALTDEEKSRVAEQVRFYKEARRLVQFGRFMRIESPFEGNTAAWIFVAPDGSEALASYFRVLCRANTAPPRFRLKGLDRDADYRVSPCLGAAGPSGVFGGDELMEAGLIVDLGPGDGRGTTLRLERL